MEPRHLFFSLCFFVLQRAFFYFLCTVSGCDGGNRTRNIAVFTWRFSPLSYVRHLDILPKSQVLDCDRHLLGQVKDILSLERQTHKSKGQHRQEHGRDLENKSVSGVEGEAKSTNVQWTGKQGEWGVHKEGALDRV